jgi:hypothetical protein
MLPPRVVEKFVDLARSLGSRSIQDGLELDRPDLQFGGMVE